MTPFSALPQVGSESAVRLVVRGEVDLETCERFGAAIYAAVTRADAVVVDLDEVTFLDSTGVKALMEGHALAQVTGSSFTVVNSHGLVRRVLATMGVLATLTQAPEDA